MVYCGYGMALDIDLSTGKTTKRQIDPEFAHEFIGGMGFGGKLLYDEVGPDVDPLAPQNVIVIANGPLTGTQAPCSGRTEITTKDPLTGNISSGNFGGTWGAALKRAGFDLVIIRNKVEKPVYLWIDDNVVAIRDASHLWGKDTHQTSDMLAHEVNPSEPSRISVLAIGPAGEHLVRFACPVIEYYHIAARCGAGAVMGSKGLKAIAVRGTGTAKAVRPTEFQEAVKKARERLDINPETAKRVNQTSDLHDARKYYLEHGCLPAKNFQTGFVPQFLETRGQEVARRYFTRRAGTCHACPMPCFNLVEVNEGKYAGLKHSSGTRPGFVFAWGATCAIDNLPAIWKCLELCGQFGIDYASTTGSIAFAMELYQRGILTKTDTDGLELTWGNEDAVIELLHKIAFREGFGDILADGALQAAKKIGNGTEQYAMTIKGREMAWTDPRAGTKGWVFGYLTNPRGGDNVKNTHFYADRYNSDWWVDKFDMPDEVKKRLYSMPPQEVSTTWEGKPLMAKWFEDLYSVSNSLGLCFFPAGFLLSWGPTNLSQLFSAFTGFDTTPEEIMKSGERIFNVFKAGIARQGLTRHNDHFPNRFYTEGILEGPAKGAILSRETIDRLLDEYYELRGWDKETGLPTREKLSELGLNEIANDLRERGKLPRK